MPKADVVSIKPKGNRRRRESDRRVLPLVAPPPKGLSKKKLIEESRRWLSIINAHKLNDYKRRRIVTDTIENFASYYNKGYLEYRKSVTEGGQYAAVEWSGAAPSSRTSPAGASSTASAGTASTPPASGTPRSCAR